MFLFGITVATVEFEAFPFDPDGKTVLTMSTGCAALDLLLETLSAYLIAPSDAWVHCWEALKKRAACTDHFLSGASI